LTLVEVMLVMALLVILGAVVLPSFAGMKGNADQKAAADLVRAVLADGHGLAAQSAIPYRLAIQQDGTRLRLAPDGPDFATLASAEHTGHSVTVLDLKIEKATLSLAQSRPDAPLPTADSGGWITAATFMPDGTCLEDRVLIEVHEKGFPAMRISLRGITGTTRVLPASHNGGQP
jgi:type II secretory pathway pseudopilin PulG